MDKIIAPQALLRNKKIIILMGAGVSVAAGIPSFRGGGSLQNNGGAKLHDIMSALIKQEASLREQHCRVIAQMAVQAINAKPTKFHQMLRALLNADSLERVYTQNIDGLESKVGFDLHNISEGRCIALHGTLHNLRCDRCSALAPLEGHIPSLKMGYLPRCDNSERALSILRQKTCDGMFYPDIALYDAPIKDEEFILAAIKNDSVGATNDTALLVVGTSLTIPGVKSLLQSLGRTIASRGGEVTYLDIDPQVPEGLKDIFTSIIKMDCQEFAQGVLEILRKQDSEQVSAVGPDERKDGRPLWDWGFGEQY